MAWRRLSKEVQHQISAVLNITNATEVDELGSPMGVVANWADHVRNFLPWSGQLHFVDVRDDLIQGGCHYGYNSTMNRSSSSSSSSSLCDFDYYHRDCVDGNCAVGAILNYSTQLIEYYNGNLQSPSVKTRYLRQRTTIHEESNPNRFIIDQPKSTPIDSSYLPFSSSIRQALMFLIHFIGDVHQPLHVSRASDRGGNDINVKYHLLDNMTQVIGYSEHPANIHHSHHHSYNLHSIWDTALIETALQRRDYSHDDQTFNNSKSSRSELEGSLESLLTDNPELLERFTRCQNGSGARHLQCVIEWGHESWGLALKYAYTKNTPWSNATQSNGSNNQKDDNVAVDVASGDEIDEDYYASRLPIIKEQLIAGGVRLAATLEDIFGDTTHFNK